VLRATVAGTAVACDGGAAELPAVARASNVDFGLNVAGTLSAPVAAGLELAGAVDRWSRFRDRWFIEESRGALVLLALWPFALLFPAAVPLGLGQVLERLEARWPSGCGHAVPGMAAGARVELQPLVPAAELLCVALGAFMPCLLGYSVVRSVGRRAVLRPAGHRARRIGGHGAVFRAELGADACLGLAQLAGAARAAVRPGAGDADAAGAAPRCAACCWWRSWCT
jgi:hypothetical protein